MVSCSGWMVATMSRIGPVRGRSISDSRMSDAPRAVARGQVLVLVRGQPAVREAESAAAAYAHRLARPGLVERQRHAGPPVDHHRLAAGLAGHVPAADVEGLVLLGAQRRVVVQPAEEQRHLGSSSSAFIRRYSVCLRCSVETWSPPIACSPAVCSRIRRSAARDSARWSRSAGQRLGRVLRACEDLRCGSVGVGVRGSRYPLSASSTGIAGARSPYRMVCHRDIRADRAVVLPEDDPADRPRTVPGDGSGDLDRP